ncbi:M55 family metallopeptidase [Halobacillus sp. A1]|uniref:M55 family metallopeptidase n=1 Tax=Halobacillus sp. A1 TaxID=2880262 RepID=UPI0020A63398|nr:M55 family metallopeptidase [Halobacillus sp. A1]MCP3030281.1 M55 family metallopeptidase [Halobacillus sp. A1]
MKLYISVDMEGITGLPDASYVDSSKHNYARGRKLMTDEVNYVIESAISNQASEILVNDSHSKMNNLLVEDLYPDAQLITGDVKPFSMMQGLDSSWDGAIFLGYHARAAQPGVMSHSMTFGVRNFYIDDVAVGELGLNAYLAGYYEVPILMVAGDDRVADEAEQLIPNIVTAVVKESISRSAVKTLTPKKAGVLLQSKTEKAIHNLSSAKPLTPPASPTLRIEFANYGQAEWASLMPGTVLEPNSTTVAFKAKDILEAYQAMLVMTELAMRTTFN